MRIPLICTTPQGLYSSSLSRWLRQSLLLFLPQEWLSWLHPSWLPGMNSPLHNSLFQRRAQDPAAELALQGIGSTGVWFSFEYFVDFVLDFFCFVLWVEILLHSPGWPGTHNTAQAVLKFTILLPLTSRCWCSAHVSPRQLVLGLVVWFFHKAFYIGVCWMETLLEKPAHSSQARVQRKNNVRRKKSRKFLSFKKRAHFRHAQKRPERHASRCSSALCTEPWDACK